MIVGLAHKEEIVMNTLPEGIVLDNSHGTKTDTQMVETLFDVAGWCFHNYRKHGDLLTEWEETPKDERETVADEFINDLIDLLSVAVPEGHAIGWAEYESGIVTVTELEDDD